MRRNNERSSSGRHGDVRQLDVGGDWTLELVAEITSSHKSDPKRPEVMTFALGSKDLCYATWDNSLIEGGEKHLVQANNELVLMLAGFPWYVSPGLCMEAYVGAEQPAGWIERPNEIRLLARVISKINR